MGGNAFNNVVRINKDDIYPTVKSMVETLDYPDLTLDYVMGNMMGSCGKKATSGDIDVALNTKEKMFYGEPDLPVFNKYSFLDNVKSKYPSSQYFTKTFKMGNLITSYPILGDPENGFVQVDFIFGNSEWLKFTHYSPSEEESKFKGVFLQQLFGIWTKMHKDFEAFDEDGNRVARVGYHFGLEKGCFRKWEMSKKKGQGMSTVSADEFETKFVVPRYNRFGYLDSPSVFLKMFFGENVVYDDLNTFEKFLGWVKTNRVDRYEELTERFLNNLQRHVQMSREVSVEEMKTFLLTLE